MVFIGSGADAAEVQEYAKPLGSKCIFTGAISQRETLRAWYCRADLFLFPSSYDTNGLVVREAAACDLAAVLIDGSCAAEGVTDGVTASSLMKMPGPWPQNCRRSASNRNVWLRWAVRPGTGCISPGAMR